MDLKKLLKNDRLILSIVGIIFCVIVIIQSDFRNVGIPEPFIVERARVLSVMGENLQPDTQLPPLYIGNQRVEIEIATGEFAGQILEVENTMSRFHNIHITKGMEIIVSMLHDLDYLAVYHMSIYGPSRGPVLIWSVILLCIGMIIIGRKKGVYAIVTLGFTIVTVIFFLVNAIVNGESPVIYALLTAIITTTFTLGMVSGFSKQTLAAIGGTAVGLLAAGIMNMLMSRFGYISGIHLDEARQIFHHTPLDMVISITDLFFAAIIIAASGAVVDTAISIASSVFEIKEQSKSIKTLPLYKSGMHIGGDILGANANTLILALTGASLATFVLIVLFGFSPLRIINLDLVAIEVTQSVSATMGMLVTIPATAILSAVLATNDKGKGKKK